MELFFKWIKQHLRIKAFYGTSENAVRVQVWTAISAYVILAIVRRRLGLQHDLHAMTQTLRLHLFAKTPIFTLFSTQTGEDSETTSCKQLSLFD